MDCKMASVHCFTPATLFVVIVSVCIAISKCERLKSPRNFAHVYGKRASQDAYNFGTGGQKLSKLSLFSGEFPVDYEPSDENFLLRREDSKVNAKANVGHMFGREIYDTYPFYSNDDVYSIPELDEEDIVAVPNVRDDELFNIPRVDEREGRRERKRQLILDLLKSSPAARMEALSYLNDIRNTLRSKA
ncbi:uncharacterized protein LOC132728805 isoform X2 [Ruditapes philippinarum]|uniref:uncharacterized protein LOC132728805 isoform X2 n=1 Tax=Ruditapes philippinarum TaxID=129788 RepID=UPI00295B8222|nr:uncharacterized protein LOC132728805 isoform X2 [Ruditapes philippinarum]